MLGTYAKRLADDGTLTLTVRARPNARVTKLGGVLDDGSVKIDVRAAPEDGEANDALLRFLAEQFGVPASCVTLVAGQRGRLKTIRIVRP